MYMTSSKRTESNRNHHEGSQVMGYQCPSCKMLAWYEAGFESEALCPFCSHALPNYVTKNWQERMFMRDQTDAAQRKVLFKRAIKRHHTQPVGADSDKTSPFLLEFFMVQGAGFRCMAYRNGDGKWRGAFNNEELPGAIRILE
jgi:hypothetical protein